MKRAALFFVAMIVFASLALALPNATQSNPGSAESIEMPEFDDIEIDDNMEFKDPFGEIDAEISGMPVPGIDEKIEPASKPGHATGFWERCNPAELVREAEKGEMENVSKCAAISGCPGLEKAMEILKEKDTKVAERLVPFVEKCKERRITITGSDIPRRIREIKESSLPVDEKIRQLRELRREIDREIERLLKERRKIMAEEIVPLAGKIRIEKGIVKAGNVSVRSNASIVVGNDTEIEIDDEGKAVIDGIAEAEEIEIGEDGIYVKGRKIKVTPREIRRLGIERARIKTMDGKPFYEAEKEEEKRLLFVIPVKIRESILVDAETGKVVRKRPFWAILAR